MDGAVQSSGRNDDFNILHKDEGVVREFLEEFEKADEIEREDLNAVISQGQNISDIVAHIYDRPIKRSEGEWSNMVLAAEEGTGKPDEVVIHPTYGDAEYDVVAKTSRGDKSRSDPAAGFNLEFYDEDFHKERKHNAFLTAVGDLMVGRGHETDSNIRNTELLMYTLTEMEEPIDSSRVEKVNFDLDSELEDNPAKADYNFKVVYDDGKEVSGRLEELAYSSDLFEDMDSVGEYLQEGGYSNPAVSALEFWSNLFEAGVEANPFLSTDYDSSKNQRAD
jgi:hypothetical protein